VSQPANETREWHNGPEIENGRRIHDKQIVTGEKKNWVGTRKRARPCSGNGKVGGSENANGGTEFHWLLRWQLNERIEWPILQFPFFIVVESPFYFFSSYFYYILLYLALILIHLFH